jgi:hypothetical protein
VRVWVRVKVEGEGEWWCEGDNGGGDEGGSRNRRRVIVKVS